MLEVDYCLYTGGLLTGKKSLVFSKVCHPGGYCWDYYPGALSVSYCNSFEERLDWVPIGFIYGCPILSLAKTWIHHDRVPG